LAQAKTKTGVKAVPESRRPQGLLDSRFEHRLREAGMLLSLGLALMMLASLISYDPADPAWSHSGSNAEPSNFVGSAGAWLSDLMFYLFGYMAYLLPVMLIYNAVLLIRSRLPESEDRYQLLAVRWGGFVLTLVSGCALASLHFSASEVLPLGAGGILGQIAGDALSRSLGLLGATILHLALFLGGLTLFTGISWLVVSEQVGRATLWLVGRLVDRWYLMRASRWSSRSSRARVPSRTSRSRCLPAAATRGAFRR